MKIIKSITIIIALIISSLVFSQDPEEGPLGPPSQTTPNILNPYNLTALNITQTSASLSWNDPNPNNTSWEIGVYSNNNSPSFSVFGNFSEVPYTITGLTPGTGYSFIVRLNSSGIFTEWAGSYNFTTLSPIVETPIVQLPIVQNLCTKTIQPYSVNVGDAIHDASTYVWSVSPETPIAIITGNGTNSITIDWANVPDGVYTLQAIETNLAGCSSTAVSATINLLPTPAPVAPAQSFCTTATVANLTATGTNLQWYDVTTGGTALAPTTLLTTGTYYVSQTEGSCESPRTTVNVTVTPQIAPTFTTTSVVCSGTSLTDLPTTSTNGISGTWSPALNNLVTTTYTFTPNEGQCAATTTQTITIANPLTSSPISFMAAPAAVAALPSVTIGTQIWTNINLDVSTYRDGTPIPQVTDPTAWANLTTGAWCYYDNDPANGAIYGKLYNWYAVAGIHDNDPNTPNKTIAPLGWHVPSDQEWTTLTDYLGGESVAGGKMKETGTVHWRSPNQDATNSSGFTGLPRGAISPDDGPLYGGTIGMWWASGELQNVITSAGTAICRMLNWDRGDTDRGRTGAKSGLSVRLIKD